VAEGLEALYPDNPDKVFLLVTHWGAAGDRPKERHYLASAIPQALGANGYQEVVKMTARAIELTTPDDPQLMRLFRWLGDAYSNLSDYQPALESYDQSLALAMHYQDDLGAAECLRQMASLVWERGDYDLSRGFALNCLQLARQLDNQELVAASINQLAASAWFQGQYSEAESYYEESLAVSRQNQNLAGIAVALNNLAMVQAEFGDYVGARAHLEESLAIKRKLGDQRRIAITLTNLGMVAGRVGDYQNGKAFLEQAMYIERKIGNRAGLGKSMEYFADILQHEGDHSAAKALHIQSVELRRRIGERPGIVYSLIALAFNHLLLESRDKAHADLYEALTLAREMKSWPRVVEIMVGFAWLKRLDGEAETAATWLGMALNHPVMTQDIYQNRAVRLLDLLRADLGQSDLTSALDEGKALEFDSILQEVLAQG
jgi:tetratricopeptide (TPR) repeat protein